MSDDNQARDLAEALSELISVRNTSGLYASSGDLLEALSDAVEALGAAVLGMMIAKASAPNAPHDAPDESR